MASIESFIFHDLRRIEGYIDARDALVFLALIEAQTEAGYAGGLAEIGVYYGRSYFLMRKAIAPARDVVAIDLFDQPVDAASGRSQYDTFLGHGRALGLPVDETMVIRGDSTALSSDAIIARVGPCRFFSIDGGHALADVVSDSLLASDALAPHGVIVFDDTFNPAWPEVTVAVGDFLRSAAGFNAFCLTRYKTYVCRQDHHAFYRRTISESPRLRAFHHTDAEFLGAGAIRIEPPLTRRVLYEVLSHSGLSALAGRAYHTRRRRTRVVP